MTDSPSDEQKAEMAKRWEGIHFLSTWTEEDYQKFLEKYTSKPLSHKEQFIAMIEPRQSFVLRDDWNAVIIRDVYEGHDLWIYFDRKTNEFLEMRVES